jgi:hypothetical protein
VTENPAGSRGGQFKLGALTHSERMAKRNEMLRIEEVVGGARLARPSLFDEPDGPLLPMDRKLFRLSS